MSQNENDSPGPGTAGEPARHKVIADLHSGMVLLAAVRTRPEELPTEPEDLVNTAGSKGSA